MLSEGSELEPVAGRVERAAVPLHHYPDVASMFIIISRVLWSTLRPLNLLRAQTQEPDLSVVHDFLLLIVRQHVLKVLESL